MHRYHLPDFHQPLLAGTEAHHCREVLRQKAGDLVTVFDGRGTEAPARLESVAAGGVHLRILEPSTTVTLATRVTLAMAVLKKNMDLLVQKATELGVARIAPVFTERTVVRPGRDSATKSDRWRTIALEACKQSGNNWLPEIDPPRSLTDFLATAGRFDLALISSLQPEARPLKQILRDVLPDSAPRQGRSVLLLIGPEGDFTAAEIAAAKGHGCQPLSLGPLTLRAETAALYALSILHHELQDR